MLDARWQIIVLAMGHSIRQSGFILEKSEFQVESLF